jgi:membrane-bound ClpP family serine protease
VSWIWNIKLRLLVGGSVLIVLGLVLYLVRGMEAALILPVVGIVLLTIGVIYKPRKKKTENVASEAE